MLEAAKYTTMPGPEKLEGSWDDKENNLSVHHSGTVAAQWALTYYFKHSYVQHSYLKFYLHDYSLASDVTGTIHVNFISERPPFVP